MESAASSARCDLKAALSAAVFLGSEAGCRFGLAIRRSNPFTTGNCCPLFKEATEDECDASTAAGALARAGDCSAAPVVDEEMIAMPAPGSNPDSSPPTILAVQSDPPSTIKAPAPSEMMEAFDGSSGTNPLAARLVDEAWRPMLAMPAPGCSGSGVAQQFESQRNGVRSEQGKGFSGPQPPRDKDK